MSQFTGAINKALEAIRTRSSIVHPDRWQSVDVSSLPEAATHEVLNHRLTAQVYTSDLDVLRADIQPNLPWADDHFLERVGGKPLNPGVQWAHWPWANSADKFRTEKVPQGGEFDGHYDLGFSHTYMERMWPRKANLSRQDAANLGPNGGRTGIRYKFGDAMDVVKHLAKHPLSRQAYLPIWFPEDTGKDDVRVPCTLGYHFIMRGGYLHCTYYIRSCDAYRHLRDDVYLTVRLLLWMLDELVLYEQKHHQPVRLEDAVWQNVKPGLFTMHIVSLHVFRNDYIKLFGAQP